MVHRLKLLPVAALLVLGACYHATIDTGLAPSTTIVEKAWAASFIDGLVPPQTLETQAQCKNGVSKVETQLPFLNLLVGAITLGIYTPMSLKVTCAASGRASIPAGAATIQVGESPTPQQMHDALTQAIVQAVTSGAPVYIEH
jgi:hypothetical protein